MKMNKKEKATISKNGRVNSNLAAALIQLIQEAE